MFSIADVYRKFLVIFLCLLFVVAPSFAFATQEGPQGFTFEGKLYNSTGTAPVVDTVDFVFDIYNQLENCLLYEEAQPNINLVITNGDFALTVGSPQFNPKRTANDPQQTLAAIFSNSGSLPIPVAVCPGTPYLPGAGEVRYLRVFVTPHATGIQDQLAPDMQLNAAPTATSAETLLGIGPTGFINVEGNVTQANMNLLTGGGDITASNLHNHDSRYAQLGSGVTQNLGSGNLVITGDMGIGALVPAADLDIERVNPTIQLGASAGGTSSLNFYSNTGADVSASIQGSDAANTLTFSTGGAQAIQITAGQNVSFSKSVVVTGTMQVGQYTAAQEGAVLLPFLTGAGLGALGTIWANSTTPELRYWDGAAMQTIVNTNTTGLANYLRTDGSVAMTGANPLSVNNKIINVTNPTLAQDAATKNYVDNNLAGSTLTTAGLANGQALIWNSVATQWQPGAVGGVAGGANTNVQFNNAGAFLGTSDFTWDNTNYLLTLNTTHAPAGDALIIAQNPTASNTKSLVRLGSADLGVTASASGTYIGINQPAATSDVFNYQVAGANKFLIDKNGNVTATSFTGNGSTLTNITPTFAGLSPGGVGYASSATTMASSAVGVAGQVLLSGAAAIPTWATDLTVDNTNHLVTVDAGGAPSGDGLKVPELPITLATKALLALGPADITGGNVNGNFIGVNTSAAYTGLFADFENNSVVKYTLESSGIPSALTDIVNVSKLNGVIATSVANYLPLDASVSMTGANSLNMGTSKIINLVDPTNPQEAATKNYVDTHAGALSSLTAATIAHTIDSLNFAQSWNWSTLNTQTAMDMNANSLTSGSMLSLASTSTGVTADMENITLSGSNVANTGNLLTLNSSGAASIAKLLNATSASTGAFANGGARFNFTGAHTGNGVEVDDVTTAGTVMALTDNALTGGKGFALASSATGMTGDLENITLSGSNAANTGNLLTLNSSGALSAASPLNITNAGTGTSLKVTNTGTGYAGTFMGGNVGIGATNPGAQLEVDSSANALIGEIIKGPAAPSVDIFDIDNNAGTPQVYVDSSYVLHGNGSGLTGVITSAVPLSGLTAATGANTIANGANSQTWNWNDGATALSLGNSGAGSTLAVANTGTGYAATFMGGNVGIGTATPQGTLDVYGVAFVRNGNQGLGLTGALRILPYNPSGSSEDMYFELYNNGITATGNVMHFTGAAGGNDTLDIDVDHQNVGIGTTTPSYPLDISGDMRVAQFIHSSVSDTALRFNPAGGLNVVNNADSAWQSIVSGAIFSYNNITGSTFYSGSGSAGQPAYSFYLVDTTTGMFHPAASTIAFSNNGTETMRINASGYVGIGATGPGAQLEVDSNGNGVIGEMIRAPAAPTVDIFDIDNSAGVPQVYVDDNFVLHGNGSGLTTVTAAAVPLNSITAATGANTIANGANSQTWNWNNGSTAMSLGNSGAGTTLAVANTGTGYAATFTGGNVGIGTGAPINTTFEVLTASGTAFFDNASELLRLTPVGGLLPFNVTDSTDSVNWLTVQSTGNVVMNGGNVGIGTTGPSYTLDVENTGVGTAVAYFQNGTGSCTLNPTGGGGTTGLSCSSDIRLKEDVKPLENSLDKLEQIRGVSFLWKNTPDQKKRSIGFIAQELEKVFPELVAEDKNGYKQVNYANFVAVLTNAVKELYGKFTGLDTEIVHLKADSAAKDTEISKLKDKLKNLEQTSVRAPASEDRFKKLESENAGLKARLDQIEKKLSQGSVTSR